MEIREKLIEIAKKYSDKIIQEFLNEVAEDIKINVYISGSVSYGYCDEMSDIEMEFYLPDETPKDVKEKLQKIIDENPKFEDIRMSAGVSGWPLEKIANGSLEEFWNQQYPYMLYELEHAMPIKEDLPLIEEVRQKIKFYPDDELQKIIKGLWLTIYDNGMYNAEWSFKRNQITSSNIFLFISLEAVLRLAYLLNKKYFPHTKWLEKELTNLENDFGLKEFMDNIEKMSLKEKLELHRVIVERIGRFMGEKKILRQELLEDAWKVMHEDYYIFNPMKFGEDESKSN